MRRGVLAGFAVLAFSGLSISRPAAAQQITTSIDLNYTYGQDRRDGDVEAVVTYGQKYDIKYETSLTTAYDFLGAVRLQLEDKWSTSEAHTARISPTLELQVKSSLLAVRVAYDSAVAAIDPFEETAGAKAYAESLAGELLMTPAIWPQFRLKLQRRREYELRNTERTVESMDLSLVKDLNALRLELSLKSEQGVDLRPEQSTSEADEWTGKATYKEILYGGTEFEIAYETGQKHAEEQTRGVFAGSTEESRQRVKSRLKNSLALAPSLTLGLSWEYQFEQDLLVLDFDQKLNNKYRLDARWDMMEWLKLTAEARRETDLTVNDVGLEDERKLTDGLKGAVDIELVDWLRVSAKAELQSAQAVAGGTGGSVDRKDDEKYEVVVKNRIGSFWDLTLDGASSQEHEDGFLASRKSKAKANLRLAYAAFGAQPSYEISRETSWDPGIEEPAGQKQSREAKLKFDYKMKLLEMFAVSFAHEYGVKIADELDQVLNFERTLQFNEDTRISVAIAEIIRDLRLEGEVDRKASDTEGDADPERIELSYALKLDFKLERLSLTASFKYNDKGDTFDDVSFNTKIGWKGDRLDLAGEYQFDKIFADITDENRKLNLKLNYKF